jgi:hypothetical protein
MKKSFKMLYVGQIWTTWVIPIVHPIFELMNCTFINNYKRVPPNFFCNITKVGFFQGSCIHKRTICQSWNLGTMSGLVCMSSD